MNARESQMFMENTRCHPYGVHSIPNSEWMTGVLPELFMRTNPKHDIGFTFKICAIDRYNPVEENSIKSLNNIFRPKFWDEQLRIFQN